MKRKKLFIIIYFFTNMSIYAMWIRIGRHCARMLKRHMQSIVEKLKHDYEKGSRLVKRMFSEE